MGRNSALQKLNIIITHLEIQKEGNPLVVVMVFLSRSVYTVCGVNPTVRVHEIFILLGEFVVDAVNGVPEVLPGSDQQT